MMMISAAWQMGNMEISKMKNIIVELKIQLKLKKAHLG